MPEADGFLSSFSMPAKTKPIPVGERFGDLVVVGPAEPFTRANGRKVSASRCLCLCGSERRYKNNGLRSGYWKSCGCKQKENAAAGRVTHGHARGGRRSPELSIWRGMIRRCSDMKCEAWPHYGGRDIKVCQKWADDFKAFLADVGPKPSPKHSLERIDNDGNYEPGNVRWATPIEQANNKRNNLRITYKGEHVTLSQLARMTKLPIGALRRRLVAGMDVDAAIQGAKARKRFVA